MFPYSHIALCYASPENLFFFPTPKQKYLFFYNVSRYILLTSLSSSLRKFLCVQFIILCITHETSLEITLMLYSNFNHM